MKLNIKYSKESEINRIKATLNKLKWYKEHGIKLLLPEGISLTNTQEIIDKDYKEKDYKKAEDELISGFNKIPLKFFEDLKKITKKKLLEELEIYLTKYGCGGSYNLPNRIIININYIGRNNHGSIYCLKHELIHLMVEDEVQKRKLNQEQKEDWVNEIMKESGED